MSPRQKATLAAGGKTLEEQAQERRQQRIEAQRRRELEQIAHETLAGCASDDERRYLLDRMARELARTAGRPQGDREQWARDVAELNGNTKALAERWGITQRAARKRRAELNTRI